MLLPAPFLSRAITIAVEAPPSTHELLENQGGLAPGATPAEDAGQRLRRWIADFHLPVQNPGGGACAAVTRGLGEFHRLARARRVRPNAGMDLAVSLRAIGLHVVEHPGPLPFDVVRTEIDRRRPMAIRIGGRPKMGGGELFLAVSGYGVDDCPETDVAHRYLTLAHPDGSTTETLYETVCRGCGEGSWDRSYFVHMRTWPS